MIVYEKRKSNCNQHAKNDNLFPEELLELTCKDVAPLSCSSSLKTKYQPLFQFQVEISMHDS